MVVRQCGRNHAQVMSPLHRDIPSVVTKKYLEKVLDFQSDLSRNAVHSNKPNRELASLAMLGVSKDGRLDV